MIQRGHIPQRMCEGCRRRFAKESLVRFTVSEEGGSRQVVIDRSGSGAGRGAYVCRNSECLRRAAARKNPALVRRLGASAVHPDLEEEFKRLIKARA